MQSKNGAIENSQANSSFWSSICQRVGGYATALDKVYCKNVAF